MGLKETWFYFKQACVHIALTALHRLRMKIIFSSKDGLVDYVIELYREMLRFNHEGVLMSLFKRKMLELSLKVYKNYEKEFEKETLKR